TKNIDRLRSGGALLKNCFCTNSICVPSRASIMTGQYSHVSGIKTLNDSLAPDRNNVAKKLQVSGYQTALIGKWHLKERPAGFDYFNVLRGQGRYFNPILYSKDDDWKTGGQEYEGYSTDIITDQSIDWMNNRGAEKPFFLMCHFKAVHEPFFNHPRYQSLFAGTEIPEPEDLLKQESPEGKRFDGWPMEILADRFLKRPATYPPPAFEAKGEDPESLRRSAYEKFIKAYLRTVAGIDDNVGRLLDYLDRSGLAENTVVIYTSDQGYFLGEHNLFDKRFMLEESLRMPFIIRYPREIPTGMNVEEIVLNVDFPSLFLDYAGVETPAAMQGQSFRTLLRGKLSDGWRDAMYYHYWTHQPERPSHYGVRTQKHKLIYYYGLIRSGKKPEDCWELYDLEIDPGEQVNRYNFPEYKEVQSRLKQRLTELRLEFKDTSDPI
ncbi:sulfatase, partial [Acidobacteriota bacterium]